jgi:hypothetical protein
MHGAAFTFTNQVDETPTHRIASERDGSPQLASRLESRKSIREARGVSRYQSRAHRAKQFYSETSGFNLFSPAVPVADVLFPPSQPPGTCCRLMNLLNTQRYVCAIQNASQWAVITEHHIERPRGNRKPVSSGNAWRELSRHIN